MKKRSYRAQKVNEVRWEELADRVKDKAVVWAMDVAKVEQYGVLMDSERQVVVTLRWAHPAETPTVLDQLRGLPCGSLTAVMESSGVYGDTLRWQLREAGIEVHLMSAKRVHDACEVYDGVPSMHDAKAAQVIGRLYFEGASRVWVEASEQERSHDAIGRLYRLYQKQHQQQKNRLEAALQRHWPELTHYLDLDGITLEELIVSYGSPAELSARAEEGRERLRRISRGKLAAEQIEAVLESACKTIGVPCVAAEREYLMALGAELRHSREQKERVGLRLSALTQADPQLHALGMTLGRVTTGLLIAEGLDPRAYANSSSYCKALGLNLKERSSGQHKGQLKITKRGSGPARRDLYLATLRLINHNEMVSTWYEKKVQAQGGRGKLKIVVALMRKLSRALWHLARGQAFDARRLCAAG
ncbi:MAG: transposase [Beggiatoa sp.]|nr:transposase [Beggiatoa sp.]